MKYEMKCYGGNHPRILVTEEFVKRNNFTLKRTQEEIKDRMKTKDDMLGFSASVLMDFIPFRGNESMYVEEYVSKVNSGESPEPKVITDIYEATQDFLDYMVFGWMKAMDQRGISASRTISKLNAWLWLLGREDLADLIDRDDLYNPYGMPALIEVCKQLGIEVPKDCLEFAGNPV